MDRSNSNKSDYYEFTSMTVSQLFKETLPAYQPQHVHQYTCPVHTSSRKGLCHAAEWSQKLKESALFTSKSCLASPYLSSSQFKPGQKLKEHNPSFMTDTRQKRSLTEDCSTDCISTDSEETRCMSGLSMRCRSSYENSVREWPQTVSPSVCSNSSAASTSRMSPHPSIKGSRQVIPLDIDTRNVGDRGSQITPMKSNSLVDSKSTILRIGQFDGTDSVEDVEMVDVGEHDEMVSIRPSGSRLRDFTHTSDNSYGYSDGDISMQDAHSISEALHEILDTEQQSNDKVLDERRTTTNDSKDISTPDVLSSQKSVDSGIGKDTEISTASFHRKNERLEPNALALSKHAQAEPGKLLAQISPARARRRCGDYCSNKAHSIRVTNTTTTITIDGGRLL